MLDEGDMDVPAEEPGDDLGKPSPREQEHDGGWLEGDDIEEC